MKRISGVLVVGWAFCIVGINDTFAAAIELYNTSLVNDPNLVGYWRLEGNSHDAKNSNNGTDTNVAYSTGNGKFNQGAGFNGTSSKIVYGNIVTAPWSISLWLNASATSGIFRGVYETGTNYACIIYSGTLETYSNEGGSYHELASSMNTGQWYHVVITCNGTTESGYLNGQRSYSQPRTINSYAYLQLGKSNWNDQYLNGKLDDVALFNRVLTDTEIYNLYNGPTPTNTPSVTPTSTLTPTITPTNTPTNTPTDTPTQTPTNTPTTTHTNTPTPTQTPTPTNTPDIVPPDAPVVTEVRYTMAGQIKTICGTASSDTATVEVFDGVPSIGIVGPTPLPNPTWCVTLSTPLAAGPHSIRAVAEDASGQNNGSVSDDYSVTQSVAVNAHQESDPLLTRSTGTSLRLEKTGSQEFKLSVNADGLATVKAWMRKNTDYAGTSPKLTLTGLGISGTGAATASMSGGADAWEELTVTGTPNAAGVLTLKVETFSTAPDARAWIDDITVSQ